MAEPTQKQGRTAIDVIGRQAIIDVLEHRDEKSYLAGIGIGARDFYAGMIESISGGQTPVSYALRNGTPEVREVLADALRRDYQADMSSKTAVQYVLERAGPEARRVLAEAIEAQSVGITGVSIALRSEHPSIRQIMSDAIGYVEGLHPDASSSEKYNPIAAKCPEDKTVIQFALVSDSAEVRRVIADYLENQAMGRTPLSIALRSDDPNLRKAFADELGTQ